MTLSSSISLSNQAPPHPETLVRILCEAFYPSHTMPKVLPMNTVFATSPSLGGELIMVTRRAIYWRDGNPTLMRGRGLLAVYVPLPFVLIS